MCKIMIITFSTVFSSEDYYKICFKCGACTKNQFIVNSKKKYEIKKQDFYQQMKQILHLDNSNLFMNDRFPIIQTGL